MKILVVYYSRTGHTQKVATALAARLGAEIVRIEPEGRVNLAFGVLEALMSFTAGIRACRTDLADIDVLVVATPVWANKVPPYVNMYLSLVTGIEQKPYYVIVERGTPGSDKPADVVRKQLDKKGMHHASSMVTLEEEVDKGMVEDKIQRFAEIISKNQGRVP